MKAKRIPLLDAITSMDRQMAWQGFKPARYQPPRSEVLARFYVRKDGVQAGLALTHADVMHSYIDLNTIIAIRIQRAMSQCGERSSAG